MFRTPLECGQRLHGLYLLSFLGVKGLVQISLSLQEYKVVPAHASPSDGCRLLSERHTLAESKP